MKKLSIMLLICLLWQTAAAEGPRRFWKKINRRPKVCFAGHSPHLSGFPGHRRRLLPANTLCFSTSDGFLYWYSGRFYVHRDGFYNPVLPAAGMFFYRLPQGFMRYVFMGEEYYFLNGFCFRAVPGGFCCQAPPMGIRVTELPSGEIQSGAIRGEVLLRNQIWHKIETPQGSCYEFAGFCPG